MKAGLLDTPDFEAAVLLCTEERPLSADDLTELGHALIGSLCVLPANRFDSCGATVASGLRSLGAILLADPECAFRKAVTFDGLRKLGLATTLPGHRHGARRSAPAKPLRKETAR